MSKTTAALDTIHHYLRLAGKGEPFDTGSCFQELSGAIDTLKEFVAGVEASPMHGLRVGTREHVMLDKEEKAKAAIHTPTAEDRERAAQYLQD